MMEQLLIQFIPKETTEQELGLLMAGQACSQKAVQGRW